MKDYKSINRDSWNKRTEIHFESEFYDNKSFLEGRNSLNSIEMAILGDLKGKSVLHLQCHFGQDSISLKRLGAERVVGVDLSNTAIDKANLLAQQAGEEVEFICSDVFDFGDVNEEEFDVVFVTYGTIGWLPDIDRWAGIVANSLRKGGRLVFAEFHPVVWMFDDDFNEVRYNYFHDDAIDEVEDGTYTNPEAEMSKEYISWNHGLGEVVSALLNQGLTIDHFKEYDYSPYNCFRGTKEIAQGKFIIEKMGGKLPMVYSILALK